MQKNNSPSEQGTHMEFNFVHVHTELKYSQLHDSYCQEKSSEENTQLGATRYNTGQNGVPVGLTGQLADKLQHPASKQNVFICRLQAHAN